MKNKSFTILIHTLLLGIHTLSEFATIVRHYLSHEIFKRLINCVYVKNGKGTYKNPVL